MQFLFLGLNNYWLIAIRGIGIVICKFIYWLIAIVFELFMTVSRLNILSSESIKPIYQRITMILTIVMTLYVAFNMVKYVIQPDAATDKEKGIGNIGLKIVVVILAIAFVPKIFEMGYDLQNRLIENQTFSKIILGKSTKNFQKYGYNFSANMFSLFYKVDEETCGQKCDEAQALVDNNLQKMREEGTTKYLDDGINEGNKVEINGKKKVRPVIYFNGIFAILVGLVIGYVLIVYCINLGTRYAQLLFLQIIAPVAIIGYLSPKKDNMFKKWGKQCLTTYLDLFIRISIIYFVFLIIDSLGAGYANGSLFAGLGNISNSLKVFTYIVLILGLLLFAKKAPDMLKELFPSGGAAGIGFSPKSPKQIINDAASAPILGRGLGMAYAGAGSMLKNTRKSAGKAWDAFRDARHLTGDEKKEKQKEAYKWIFRGTLGNVGAGLSGAGLGFEATNVDGMKRAMKNAYDRRQSKYKITDAGYKPIGKGAGRYWGDKGRRIFLRDENIEDMANASDISIQSLQETIAEATRKLNPKFNDYTAIKSKVTGEYLYYHNGKEMTNKDFENAAIAADPNNYQTLIDSINKIADLNSQLGKMQSKSKALHQKENESKDKK